VVGIAAAVAVFRPLTGEYDMTRIGRAAMDATPRRYPLTIAAVPATKDNVSTLVDLDTSVVRDP
jgi:hypothetical protein